jgi:6-pyruvoyltetrahydropterin/6-carboxytetrahydropterin synthase
LDERNWVQDFGGLKKVKAFLDETFDHKTLVAGDDPQYELFAEMFRKGLIDMIALPAVGAEKFAEFVFQRVTEMGFTSLKSVEIWEHAGNSAKVIRKEPR